MTFIEQISKLNDDDAIVEIISYFHDLANIGDFVQMNEIVRILSESESESITFAVFCASNTCYSKLQDRDMALEKAFTRTEANLGRSYAIKLFGGLRTRDGRYFKDMKI